MSNETSRYRDVNSRRDEEIIVTRLMTSWNGEVKDRCHELSARLAR